MMGYMDKASSGFDESVGEISDEERELLNQLGDIGYKTIVLTVHSAGDLSIGSDFDKSTTLAALFQAAMMVGAPDYWDMDEDDEEECEVGMDEDDDL